jgi:hypothetical protein
MIVKALLACGIVAALLLAGVDVLAGSLAPGYRFDARSASALSAAGASTRPLVLTVTLVANALLIAFAVGIWLVPQHTWALRAIAILVAGNAILSTIAIAFFPAHPDQDALTSANTWNIVVSGLGVLCTLLAIVLGIVANDNFVRYLSIAIILLFIAGFILSVVTTGRMPAVGEPPSAVIGIQERTMIYSWLVWVTCQAIVLLRA